MTEIVCLRAETPPDCAGVAETPAFCMLVEEMPYVCTELADTPPDFSRVAGNPTLAQKERIGLMTTLEKRDPQDRRSKSGESLFF